MKKSISDLKGWPIGVWISSGSGHMVPEAATARLKSVRARGSEIHLTVVDRHGEYSSAITASSALEATGAVEALSLVVNTRLDDVGRVEFEIGESGAA